MNESIVLSKVRVFYSQNKGILEPTKVLMDETEIPCLGISLEWADTNRLGTLLLRISLHRVELIEEQHHALPTESN